ncbi:MAG: tRNA (N(6)-L-threonylcarbamoyladenosine(37)-C(2))-methylthiotransferase MtaB [Lentisphaeraceae bacterium]|nr:tRNA (N(6)-L-threonylcarbamoyladenosine(37)-C(2))-methylthiotransferase MtaB [Lentisphaeraceae bacterium]
MSNTDLKATVYTLGCRLNQSESSIMEKSLENQGYDIVPFKEESSLAIINTCTVTAKADSDCRHVIRNYIRRNPDSFVAVVGCYSQMGYKALAEIEGVDLIMGNQDKLDVVNHVQLGKNDKPLILRDRFIKDDFTIDYVGQADSKTRANLKIQDGCDFMCTFCIIPMARGRARSRDLNNLLEEATQLAKQGFQEIILTGVNIGTFNNSDCTVLEVCDKLNEIKGIERIRISSIEPTTIPTELFERMKDPSHKLVPYLHIPLQSGSDKVLKLMKRKYERQEFLDFIKEAEKSVPGICIGTDVMVGMCGEGDLEFEETCDFLINSPVAYFHVFSYSERPGTASVKMDEKVSPQVIKRRSSVLRNISERKRLDYYEKFLGTELDVLFENSEDHHWSGYTENYIRVCVPSSENLENQIRKVKLLEITADFVTGELV